jgi:uncharacterized repeat protein (TIGR02543 family)
MFDKGGFVLTFLSKFFNRSFRMRLLKLSRFFTIVATIGFCLISCTVATDNVNILNGTVTITGNPVVGQILTANTTTLGGSGIITFQWMRSAGNAVIGSNSSTYVVQTADIGHTITVNVSRTGSIGNVISAPTVVVTAGNSQNICNDCEKILCECINIPPITDEAEITVAMWSTWSGGWDGNAALRININGNNLTPNVRLASGNGPNYHTFSVNTGDVITFFWVNGGQYDYECAFAVYYTDIPPNPPFNPSSSNWSPANDPSGKVLLYKQFSGSGSVGNGTQVGTFTVLSGGNQSEPNQTPVASDFNISNLTQTVGSVTAVTITPKAGKSDGSITILYNGSTTLPTTAGTYTVTFNVAASVGWDAVNGLAGGTLIINAANQNPVASDFNIGNLNQTAGSVTAVTITPNTGKSTGTITILYNGSTTLPTTAGTYTITFNVAASAGWNAVTGLVGGTLTIASPSGITVELDAMTEWDLIDQTVQVTANTNRIFTVSGTYSTYKWYLDGTLVSSSSSYTFNKPVSVYQLVVIVTKSNADSRSARCWVTVTNTAPTYTVTYNLNSGTGTTPAAQTVTAGSSVTLSSGSGLTRSGFTFGGWNTNSSGTGTNYNAGSLFIPTSNITLYAKWNNNIGGITLTQSNRTATVNVTAGINGRIPITVTAPSTGSVTMIGTEGTSNDNDPALYNEAGTRIAYQNNGYNFTYTIPAGQTQTIYAGTGGNVARSYVITATFN